MTRAIPETSTLQEEFLKLPYVYESPACKYIHGETIQKLDPTERSILVDQCDRLLDLLTRADILTVLAGIY